MQIFLGFLLAIAIAFLAYKARSLSISGAAAAAITGTIIFGIGGLSWQFSCSHFSSLHPS